MLINPVTNTQVADTLHRCVKESAGTSLNWRCKSEAGPVSRSSLLRRSASSCSRLALSSAACRCAAASCSAAACSWTVLLSASTSAETWLEPSLLPADSIALHQHSYFSHQCS